MVVNPRETRDSASVVGDQCWLLHFSEIEVSDISTRFTISLVALLTFEVMYERVNRQLPAMETITWSSVYHVFNLLLLTGLRGPESRTCSLNSRHPPRTTPTRV